MKFCKDCAYSSTVWSPNTDEYTRVCTHELARSLDPVEGGPASCKVMRAEFPFALCGHAGLLWEAKIK